MHSNFQMDISLPWIDATFTYTPQGLPKYIYLSPPLIFPTTYNEIRTKNRPVWITPGAAPIRWMGPIRNPRWEQKRTEGYVIVSRRDQVNFQWDNDEFRFVLDQHAELDCLVLAHLYNSPWIDMSPH